LAHETPLLSHIVTNMYGLALGSAEHWLNIPTDAVVSTSAESPQKVAACLADIG
jgi:hypothetical protein